MDTFVQFPIVTIAVMCSLVGLCSSLIITQFVSSNITVVAYLLLSCRLIGCVSSQPCDSPSYAENDSVVV